MVYGGRLAAFWLGIWDVAQVLLCGWMVTATVMIWWEENYSVACNEFTHGATRLTYVMYVFYLSKVRGELLNCPFLDDHFVVVCTRREHGSECLNQQILDFVDTVFIVARGKWSQFSLLHIYHHFSIYMIYWLVVNAGASEKITDSGYYCFHVFVGAPLLEPIARVCWSLLDCFVFHVAAYWGDSYYPVIANGFVHFVMYGYYLVTSFGIRVGWGHMVTKLQLVQFVTMIWNGMYILRNSCAFPPRVAQLYVVYITSLFILFLKFYVDRWCVGGGGKSKREGRDKGKK